MIIVPTRVCNTNKCNYCGVYKKDFDKLFFSDFGLSDFFDKISLISEKTNDYELRFFWWEPFIKFDIIEKIISYFNEKTKDYNFTINTNLSLINEKQIKFIKENNIKLIISCNWDVETHSKTRWISKLETFKLYENIKKITKNHINHQINIVVNSENAKILAENILFIENDLWVKNINLLPVNYNKNWWNENWLRDLEYSFEKIYNNLKSNKSKIHFINKGISNDVALFNSEIVIDSDWKIYPSMVILEAFFLDEKDKILISDLDKSIDKIVDDFENYSNENNKIYSFFINKVLKSKFPVIMENDNKASSLFHTFLEKI